LKEKDLELIVRAHELVEEGHNYSFNDSVLMIRILHKYCYKTGNKGFFWKLNEEFT